jgi:hypothetical protein
MDLKGFFTYVQKEKTELFLVRPNDNESIGGIEVFNMKTVFRNFDECIKYCHNNFGKYFGYEIENDTLFGDMNFDRSFLYQEIKKWGRIGYPWIDYGDQYRATCMKQGCYSGFSDGACFFIDRISEIIV